jgi:hypothetical protein
MKIRLLIMGLGLFIGVAACGDGDGTNGDSGADGAAVAVVEAYLIARIEDSDGDKMRQLSCAAWEQQSMRQAASFANVDATIEGLACRKTAQDGSQMTIGCAGEIQVVYDGENTKNIPLSSYVAVEEDGEWKFCGEAVVTVQSTPQIEGNPVDAVEAYLQAVPRGDINELQELSCVGRNQAIQRDIEMFANHQLDGLHCEVDAEDNDGTRVACEEIIREENEVHPLGSYYAYIENGVWRFCGEAY